MPHLHRQMEATGRILSRGRRYFAAVGVVQCTWRNGTAALGGSPRAAAGLRRCSLRWSPGAPRHFAFGVSREIWAWLPDEDFAFAGHGVVAGIAMVSAGLAF